MPNMRRIQLCEDLLKSAATAITVVGTVFTVHKFAIVLRYGFKTRIDNTTLVSLRVKLSD